MKRRRETAFPRGKPKKTVREFPPPGDTPLDDTESVMRFRKIKAAFPREALEEAGRARATEADAKGRLDLRKEFVFTCDPQSARDYDDALSVKKLRGGAVTLGVHIADVSHFVREGGALDREARRRSTSVYFADRVVPMLPEALSNGLCSLVPGEDRLAFSVFMTFDREGRMISRSFAKSVIRSKARYTYEQVMRVISQGPKARDGFAGRKERAAILEIAALAAKLRARRFEAGALDIEIPELQIVLDAEGELSAVEARPYDESHQMVEECMVAANEAVAAELWTKGVKILARLHEPPDEEKLEMLSADMAALGVSTGDLSSRKAFSRFASSIKGHPLYPTMAVMVLRSMKRAVYDSTKIGHWGLAKRFYAHFTSPIRRYPDLVLHRQLSAYLAGRDCRIPPKTLAKMAEHATFAEENAAEAERDLAEIKKYRLLDAQSRMRDATAYDAVVSRCMPFGCFVEIPCLAVSGLVNIARLSRSYVRFDEARGVLSARGGAEWKTGTAMKVKVAGVDWRLRRVDFVPC